MYGAVSRGPRGITALVCDTARITNGITVCITACVTRRDTEHSAIGLVAQGARIKSDLTSPLRATQAPAPKPAAFTSSQQQITSNKQE